MENKGNILTRIEGRPNEIKMSIAKEKKELLALKYARNMVLPIIEKHAESINNAWNKTLNEVLDDISSSGFIGKIIKKKSYPSMFDFDYFKSFAYGFLADYKITFMQFSPNSSGDKTKPYIAMCCPCDKENHLIQILNLNNSFQDNFFSCHFLVFHHKKEKIKNIIYLKNDNSIVHLRDDRSYIQVNKIDGKIDLSKPCDYLTFMVHKLLESFHYDRDKIRSCLLGIEDTARRMNAVENKMSRLEKELKASIEKNDEINKIAIDNTKLKSIFNIIELFNSKEKSLPKGILFYGPPGTGKTLLAREIANLAGCHFEAVNISDLKGRFIGETAEKVKKLWERCREKSPSILFVDECEGAFQSRGSLDSDSFSNELVQTFISEWDGFNNVNNKVLVVGATNRHDMLDSAIISRFTISIEIPLPNDNSRRIILTNELKLAGINLPVHDDFISLSAGMSGRDIKTLVDNVASEYFNSFDEITPEIIKSKIRLVRGKSSNLSNLTWDDIVLSEELMSEFQILRDELMNSEKLERLGIPPPRSALLYGPPGTGKTQLARVLSSQSGLNFISLSTSEIKGKYTGHSGSNIKNAFEKARSMSPCIIFLDEIDIITSSRSGSSDSFNVEITGQLLQELDGFSSKNGIFLLAASNYPDKIDSAIMSRFDRKIEISLPDFNSRVKILNRLLNKKPISFDLDDVIEKVSSKTEGFSGRDLDNVIRTATRSAMKRCLKSNNDIDDIVITEDDIMTNISK